MDKTQIGRIGESSVAQYLTGKKYKILDRNYGTKFGEIDLIARAPDRTLIFIEVKFFISDVKSGLSPEDNMTTAKIDKFRRMAEYYAGLHPELIDERRGYRLDAVACACPSADALTHPLRLCEFRHYENI